LRNFVIAVTAVAAALPAWAQEAATPVADPAIPAAPAIPADPTIAAASAVPAPTAVPASLLPHDLSPWSMFLSADIVVQTVMVGLLLASVLTWTVWLAKTIELATAKRRVRRAVAALSGAATLVEAAEAVGANAGVAARLVDAASAELHASVHAPDKDGIKERIASRLERVEVHAARAMTRGTGVLATIGATAPFVGLFGTVWGIMNSFIGISVSHTTNLAVVAPGIAEALLATACGLFAAIPAVVMYNAFARSIAGYRMQLADASASTLRLVSRDLDRGDSHAAQRRFKAAE
jgi:biopolymer transport protein ExbB